MKIHPLAPALSALAIALVVAAMHDRTGIDHAQPPVGRQEPRQPIPSLADTARRMTSLSTRETNAWLGTLSAAEQDKALSILVAESGQANPWRALDHALRIHSSTLRAECAGLAIAYLHARDPRAALDRLASEADPAVRDAMERRLLPALAETLAEDAVQWLATGTMDHADHFPAFVATTVQRWAQQDPAAAAVWVTSIEEPSLRANAASALMAIWNHRSPAESDTWLSAHPDLPNVEDLIRAGPSRTIAATDDSSPDIEPVYPPDNTVVSESCEDTPSSEAP
ncbi:hypothetical protein [Luteolibacter sp. LG18]|uniref:hypothetical protein n=1 Tax=Luteolibacter sp. LG18 TaxID=2819286 RepID=UPI002B2C0207|nr:hypothetical protein llg_31320 [Luteolibacter sp. LG18]